MNNGINDPVQVCKACRDTVHPRRLIAVIVGKCDFMKILNKGSEYFCE